MNTRPHGSTLIRHRGRDFAVWKNRLRSEMPHADGTANPLLWWAMDLEARDMIACGVETKREAILAITEESETVTTPRLDLPTECAECGNTYAEADLQFGICDSCDNETRGLCACGAYPGPNRRQCRSCSAEDEADALFHADR